MHNFLRVLTRRRIWIIGSLLICVSLSVIATLMTKPSYEATATIELNKSGSGGLDLGLGEALGQQLFSDDEKPSDGSSDGDHNPQRRFAGSGGH